MSTDLAGVWEVALSDGVHRIEFEHGTTTGKRVIFVDGKVKHVDTSLPGTHLSSFLLLLHGVCRRS